MKIGLIIKARRKEIKLTLDDVAGKAGISKSALWEVEKGNSDIGFERLRRVAEALDMDIELVKRSFKLTKPVCTCLDIEYIDGRLKL
jgi:transcriptional regulator with XRE-family HTH domain